MLEVRSWLRVGDWESPEKLFVVDGEKQPHSARTQFNLGLARFQQNGQPLQPTPFGHS